MFERPLTMHVRINCCESRPHSSILYLLLTIHVFFRVPDYDVICREIVYFSPSLVTLPHPFIHNGIHQIFKFL